MFIGITPLEHREYRLDECSRVITILTTVMKVVGEFIITK